MPDDRDPAPALEVEGIQESFHETREEAVGRLAGALPRRLRLGVRPGGDDGGRALPHLPDPGSHRHEQPHPELRVAQELNIARFHSHGFDEFLIAPVPPLRIVLGEALHGAFRGLLGAGVILLLALPAAAFFALALRSVRRVEA